MKTFWGIPLAGLGLFLCWQIAESKVYEEWGMAEGHPIRLIIGGVTVENTGMYPYHVAIMYSGNFRGGGSIISEQFVLTVTHLTYEDEKEINPAHLTIAAGIIKLNAPSTIYKVTEINRYPGYSTTNHLNDICLIKVAEKIKFGKAIKPVGLWNKPDKVISTITNGTLQGVVVGFGLTENLHHSNDLKLARLTHVDSRKCMDHISSFKNLLKDTFNFCAIGDNATTVCKGDSGGGLAHYDTDQKRYYLRGVVSQGYWQGESCVTAKEALFTDIKHYIKWIEKSSLPTMYNLLGVPDCASFTTNEQSKTVLGALVNLKYAFRRTFFISDCQGVLISPKHVLTQAECVIPNKVRKLQSVAVGSSAINDQFEPSKQYAVRATSVEKDLAIITLDKEVDASIKPVCIPTRSEDGKRSVVFWRKDDKHPKYVQNHNIHSQYQISDQEFQKINEGVDEENRRLGSTPLLYTITDETGEHVYMRALEKCSVNGCDAGKLSAFVDVLRYREWIKTIAKEYIDDNILTPPLE